MADIEALAKKLVQDPASGSMSDLDQLARHYWQLAQGQQDYRTRQKLLKRSSHFAGHAFDRGLEDEDALYLYMAIARETALVHSWPQGERRKLAKIIARWLSVTGAGEHKVLAKTKGKVVLETATFALGDVGLTPDPPGYEIGDTQMIEWMTKGHRLCFGTGFDGVLKSEIRIIEGVEPVLTEKEYKKLESSTPTIVIEAPTGRIALADYALMTEPWTGEPKWASLAIEAEPGSYKACAFGFSTSRSDSVIAVLCRTDNTPPNNVRDVERLF